MNQQQLSLSELNTYIRDTIENEFSAPLWLIAEISELNINRSGHCYLDLIERDELSKKIVARQRATIWAFQFRLIKAHFESITGQELTSGLKVLINVKVNYHVLYGISVNVLDIEPAFTLGEQAKHREMVIQQLIEDGVIDMNKELDIAEIPQRIALISSDTAAGYGDFNDQLINNDFGYAFSVEFFAAVMQGEQTSRSIIDALEEIYSNEDKFDAIVIIRGGGAKAELAAFDDYDLSFMISQSPLPVLTGIGHERDQSVVDMVAWKSFKTPTAVAAFLIDKFQDFETKINSFSETIVDYCNTKLSNEKHYLEQLQKVIISESKNVLQKQNYILKELSHKIARAAVEFVMDYESHLNYSKNKTRNISKWFLEKRNLKLTNKVHQIRYRSKVFIDSNLNDLDILNEKNNSNDPRKQLDKGFAIVTKNKKTITNTKQLKLGDSVKIMFTKSSAMAQITDIDSEES